MSGRTRRRSDQQLPVAANPQGGPAAIDGGAYDSLAGLK
jgi:hypothetical protein